MIGYGGWFATFQLCCKRRRRERSFESAGEGCREALRRRGCNFSFGVVALERAREMVGPLRLVEPCEIAHFRRGVEIHGVRQILDERFVKANERTQIET